MQQKAIFAILRTGCALTLAGLLWAPASHASTGHAARTTATHTVPRAPGYLGIEFHDLTNAQAAALHLRGPRGVEVLLVDHDGPAAKAGLEPHDLITGLNGRIVASGEALRRMIHDAGAGVEVRLSVFRDGSPITLHARLANRELVEKRALERVIASPPEDGVVAGFTESYTDEPDPSPEPVRNQNFLTSILHTPPFTGAMVEAMQPQLAHFFGAPGGVGLLVQAVDSGSPAASAGLRAGDVILRADGEELHSSSQWSKRLYAGRGRPMTLSILRDHRLLTLTLQPDPRHRS